MSKSKKRILHRNKETAPMSCSREAAIETVTNSIRNRKFDMNAKKLLSLFGISGEELSEAGLTWEELTAVSSYLQN